MVNTTGIDKYLFDPRQLIQRDLATHSQIILKHNFPYREKEAERAKLAALSEAA